jgi:CyaY protein
MPATIAEDLFDRLADAALRALERAVNEVEGVQADLQSGILSIEFSDGDRFVINSHRAARQIWMAASARAWHFDVDPATEGWTAQRTNEDLWSCVRDQLQAKLRTTVSLVSPHRPVS